MVDKDRVATREDVLGRRVRRKPIAVELPEAGFTAYLEPLTAADMDTFEGMDASEVSARLKREMVKRKLVDANGKRMFSDEEVDDVDVTELFDLPSLFRLMRAINDQANKAAQLLRAAAEGDDDPLPDGGSSPTP